MYMICSKLPREIKIRIIITITITSTIMITITSTSTAIMIAITSLVSISRRNIDFTTQLPLPHAEQVGGFIGLLFLRVDV